MNANVLNMNNQLYANHHNILLGVVNDLNQLMLSINDNLIIKRIGDIILKLNSVINENKKYFEYIRNDISKVYVNMKQNFEQLKINKDMNQQIVNQNGKYYGQMINGFPEGKGVMEYNDGDKYDGEWKNAKFEGRGIYTWKDGDRYIGNFEILDSKMEKALCIGKMATDMKEILEMIKEKEKEFSIIIMD